MNTISKELADEIAAVLEKHNVTDIHIPDAMGQVLDQLKGQHLANSVPWNMGGMMFSYAVRNNVVETLKKLVKIVHGNPLNYNDGDCDCWGTQVRIKSSCLGMATAASIIEEIISGKKLDHTNCKRCNGTGVDPEFGEDLYVLVYNSHGNSWVYIVEENSNNIELTIRELPYNQKDRTRIAVMNKIAAEYQKGQYKTNYDLIRYRDNRDKGFVMNLTYAKDGSTHSCEASPRAPYTLTMVSEHFVTLLETEI